MVSSERNVSRKNAKVFGRISQTFSRNFAIFRENKWSEISRKKIRKNVKLSRNVWCLLVVLKSVFIFCFNPLIGLADKSLFKNESSQSLFLMNFHNFFVKILHLFFKKFCIFREILVLFFAKFSHYFLQNRLKRKFAKNPKIFVFFASERNAKMKRNGRGKRLREAIFPFRRKT